jgi:hypothetical protein
MFRVSRAKATLVGDWRPGSQLTPLEASIVRGAAEGQLVGREGPFGLHAMGRWGPDRTVRAGVLCHLLIGTEWPVHAKGVRLRGLRVSGYLDLEGTTIRCPLTLEHCFLDYKGPLVLDYAVISVLKLSSCYAASLKGNALVVSSELNLTGTIFSESLSLIGANIAGQLDMSGAQLNGVDQCGYSLVADGIKVGGRSWATAAR